MSGKNGEKNGEKNIVFKWQKWFESCNNWVKQQKGLRKEKCDKKMSGNKGEKWLNSEKNIDFKWQKCVERYKNWKKQQIWVKKGKMSGNNGEKQLKSGLKVAKMGSYV